MCLVPRVSSAPSAGRLGRSARVSGSAGFFSTSDWCPTLSDCKEKVSDTLGMGM